MEDVKRVLTNKELVNARGRFDEETPLHVAASEVRRAQRLRAIAAIGGSAISSESGIASRRGGWASILYCRLSHTAPTSTPKLVAHGLSGTFDHPLAVCPVSSTLMPSLFLSVCREGPRGGGAAHVGPGAAARECPG